MAVVAVTLGALVAALAGNWRPGLCAVGIVLAVPVACVGLNLFWGLTTIPAMLLIMKLLGGRSRRSVEKYESQTGDEGRQAE